MIVATTVPQPPSIVIAYVTAGAGHRRAAEAVAYAVRVRHPEARVECHDVLDDAPAWFRRGYEWSYLFLVRHASWVWKWSYRLLDHYALYRWVQPLRRRWNVFIVRRFVQRLKAAQPDVIVVTHFLPADVCSAGKAAGWLHSRLVVVVTDYHPHWFWISAQPEVMVTSVPESAAVLRQRGVDQAKIRVLGIPVGEAFGQPVDCATLQARFHLQPQRVTALVTSGGTTIGQFERVVEALVSLESVLPGRLQLLVVCGQDEAARRRLAHQAETSPMPMQIFGFVDYMADLMAASNLVVSKAGGLTISESLARGKPLVLYHIIPGQERMNAEYVARHGAAVIAHRPADVAAAVRQFIEHPGYAEAMHQAAQALSRPQAAQEIVSQAIEPLLHA